MADGTLPATTPPISLSLLDLTTNPADRMWRYPLARMLLPAAPSFLTPAHVTVFHTLMGVGAAVLVARATPTSLATAFVLFELRAVLDCFDGVLARARGLSSPIGRAMDQAGDSIAFAAFVIAAGVSIGRVHGAVAGVGLAFFATLATACGTACWDYFRRRFTSLIEHGHDEVEEEYVRVVAAHRAEGGFARWFARVVATYQFGMLNPRAMGRLNAEAARTDGLVARAHDPEEALLAARLREMVRRDDPALRGALWQVGVSGGDSTFLMLTLAAGVGAMRNGFVLAVVLTLGCVVATTVRCNRLLARG